MVTVLCRLVLLPMVFVMVTSGRQRLGVFADSMVPCYFIFGDSLADNGNNNVLRTSAKVNYTPYGIDFPYGPTGRFCNGRTIPDIIGELLGFESFIPPFATANGTEILSGVNYASGSAGILDETARQLGEHISLNMQLRNHEITISRLLGIIGSEELTSQYISKCLYTVGMGSNDFINNYFLPEYYPSSQEYTLDQFADLLIEHYTQQLVTLYNYGARKIAVFGLGLLGCTPDAINTYGTNGSACVEALNNASVIFNSKLLPIIKMLNDQMHDSTFVYINSYAAGEGSSSLELKVTNAPCCPVSDGQCIPDQTPCNNRTDYAFWDGFHPTEAINIFSAKLAFNASDPIYAYPFDIRHLVMLDQEAISTI